MNIIQNEVSKFKLSNCVKALGGMIAIAVVMAVMGAQNGLAIWSISTVVIVGLAKVADVFSSKQEASAQAEQSAFEQSNIVSLADYRTSKFETEVAA